MASKILFFTSFPPPNTGQTIASKLLADQLSGFFQVIRINTVDRKRLNRKTGDFNLFFAFKVLGKFLILFWKINTNNITTFYTVYSSTKFGMIKDFIALILVKFFCLRKITIIAHLHSGNYGLNFQKGFSKIFFSVILKYTDKLIFLTPRLNFVSDIFPNKKTAYLTNMISNDIICSDIEISDKIHRKQNEIESFDIVYISNMIPEKGFLDLARAVNLIKIPEDNRKVRVHYIGAWESKNSQCEFENFVFENSPVDSRIYGPVYDRDCIKNILLLADVFVLPTYYPIEAQPLSIIEAFNSATPVISTYHASIPDMVVDNENGFLVQIKSPVEIANAITKLYDKNVWNMFAIQARKSYVLKYSPDVVLPNLNNIFNL